MAKCEICKSESSIFSGLKLNDKKSICNECYMRAGGDEHKSTIKRMNAENIKERILEIERKNQLNKERKEIFNPTKLLFKKLYIDEKNKLWCAPSGYITGKIKERDRIFKYDELVDFEIIVDESVSVAKGALTRAVTGGLLFGETGAIVGANTAKRKQQEYYEIKITVDDLLDPNITIPFGAMMVSGDNAYTVYSALKLIAKEVSTDENNNLVSSADEIRKFKELLDDGIITNEEFEKKKKELLNL